MISCDAMLDDLIDVEDGLSAWEVEFVDDLDKRRTADPEWEPSEGQSDKLTEIWEARV